jgi:3-phosphoshikimate 1-carboxyvinyltransferase
MSRYVVEPSKLRGEITVPPSKSQTLRSILFAALANGTSVVHNSLNSPDTLRMIDACRSFGAVISSSHEDLIIQGTNGNISCTEDVINAGNSGIVLRFCTAIGALSAHPVVITGDYSIRHQRPMKSLLHALHQLGVSAESMRGDGFAPVIIKGPLHSGKTTLSGIDSQPVSALLIASSFAEGPIDIYVTDPGEKPWVTLTLDWLDRLHIPYTNDNFTHFLLPGSSRYESFEYTVPGDCSSAAFPVAAALITGSDLTIRNIDPCDAQGDKELFCALQSMNAPIEQRSGTMHIKARNSPLIGRTIDINNFVDAITILAVIACFAEGETVIKNAAVARQKECDRISCIVTELKKMGAHISETKDGLIIRKSPLIGASLDSHQDHRMAMSLTVAAMGAAGPSTIRHTECIAKTYPTFRNDFSSIGAIIQEEP